MGKLTPGQLKSKQTQSVNALARARRYRELLDQNNWSHRELAEHLQIDKSSVTKALKHLRKNHAQ